MTGQVLAEAFTRTSSGEAVMFWLLAPVALGSALAMVMSRNSVHAALFLVATMFCLAVFYVLQDAVFLGAVQIIVYAGAIMVLFLFVLMLIGVDASDSLVETLRGQRVAAVVLGLGFAGALVFPIGGALSGQSAAGLEEANRDGNVQGIARLLFTDYVLAFEVVSALLIVAALGAMVLAHRARGTPTQREQSKGRLTSGGPVTPLPGPGVYARYDAVDRPAMLPGGRPAPQSVTPEYSDPVPRTDLDEPRPGGQPIGADR
jgi:NADH-quinone oxidoreductase subunit J